MIIDDLYSGRERDALISLWEDNSIRKKVAKQIGKKLNEQGIVISSANEQLMVILSQAEFANSDEECVYVSGIIRHSLKSKEVLPRVIDSRGYDLASKCLVSLSFFYRALEKRWKYHAAPEPSFYREVGKRTFWNLGREDVSDNFEKWEMFMQEMFV